MKTFVDVKFVPNAEVGTSYAIMNTSSLTANRTVTVPDANITLVGTDATQTLQNKVVETLILQDPTTTTKKITFSVTNQNTLSNEVFEFPQTSLLNNPTATNNVLVTELATQDMRNKTLFSPTLKQFGNTTGSVILDMSNITLARTIKFPDANATLLSTENVTTEDVNFGAGIGAANLTGRTRLQQFFYAGF